MDGISVLPTLLGKEQPPKEFLYWEFYSPFHQAVRMGKWKGIRTGLNEPIHLFDLSRDVMEKDDLAPQHVHVVEKMLDIMEQQHEDSPYWPTETKSTEARDHKLYLEQN